MKAKSLIGIILLIISLILIFFLVVNRIIIWANVFRIDDKFLGMEFHAYRYAISRFSINLPYVFGIIFVTSLFLKGKRSIRYLLLIMCVVGFILAWKAYDYFAPW